MKILACVMMTTLFAGMAAAQTTSDAIWQSYVKNPDNHPNIPNVSYAGYAAGEKPLPEPKVVVSVTDHGAKGDDNTDDTKAFAAALEAAAKAGGGAGGAVLVPAGSYRVEGMLHMKYDNVVLRGESKETTTIEFINPLQTVVGRFMQEGKSAWSWSGGLVWFGPADTFDANGKMVSLGGVGQPAWEYWRPGSKLSSVKGPHPAGTKTITVDNAAGLKAGDMVLMSWANPADFSLLKAVTGREKMNAYNWASASWITSQNYPRWQWPVLIEKVAGNQVTLKQPIRLDIRPEWAVEIHALGTHVKNSGIENLTLKFNAPMGHRHLTNEGDNALYFNRAHNCFARNLEIKSTENGVNLAAAKHITITNIKFTGPEQHHHTLACRVNSHDNLFEKFVVDGPQRVKHGINTEWLSSGNVWRDGLLKKGIFDSHRAISFDSVRTNITLRNDADGPGGAGPAGPFLGKRVVHWNIKIEDSPRPIPGEFVFQPDLHPMGAFVGIQGAGRVNGTNKLTADGDKGSLVADEDKIPAIKDLYEAQLKLRLAK